MEDKNYWKPIEKEIKTKYLYIIQTAKKEDTSIIYDALRKEGFAADICENNDGIYITLDTSERLRMDTAFRGFELKKFEEYEWEDNLISVKTEAINHEDRKKIFARLAETSTSSSTAGTIILLLGMAACAYLCYLGLKGMDYKYLVAAIGSLILTIILKILAGKNIRTDSKIREMANDNWVKSVFKVIVPNKIIHREEGKKIEKTFLLAQDRKVLRYWFTGFDTKYGDEIDLYIREKSNKKLVPEEISFVDEKQLCYFNGIFIALPKNYEIAEQTKKLLAKYEKQELKATVKKD